MRISFKKPRAAKIIKECGGKEEVSFKTPTYLTCDRPV